MFKYSSQAYIKGEHKMSQIQKKFLNYQTNGSSNFITLLKYLESNDCSWIKKLSKRIF